MRGKARKDNNHHEIAEVFEKGGASVMDTSAVGDGFPDMLVCVRGKIYLVEVKNPRSSYGRKGLNPKQRKIIEDGWQVEVMTSVDDAVKFMARIRSTVEQLEGLKR